MEPARWSEPLRAVWDVLNRTVPVDPLPSLHGALSARGESADPIRFALGFDTNAMFFFGRGKRGSDIADYIRTRHTSPIVVPGQTIQEIWKNHLVALRPKTKELQELMKKLEAEAEKLEYKFAAEGEVVKEAIDALVDTHGDVVDGAVLDEFRLALEALMAKAEVTYVPRAEFAALAEARRRTKTPPGFEDGGDGDFYVWSDFLYGLKRADPMSFDEVVLVTNDVKKDWSRAGIAHPVLSAEVEALIGKPFRLWTVERLGRFTESI